MNGIDFVAGRRQAIDARMTTRRRFTFSGLAAAAVFAASPALGQQKYPNRPIRWIVGFPPGGGSDFLARTVASALSEQMGQPVVIDNRPGAGAMIAAEVASRAAADGYTLWTGDQATLVFNPMVYRRVPYKVSDFQPIGLMGRFNMVIATGANTGFESMKQAIAAMRKDPGKYSYGSVGAGTPHHIVMELFKKSVGVEVEHIPYKGLAPVLQDLLGGQIQFAPIDSASVRPYLKDGKLKALALTSNERLSSLPGVPTMIELGFPDVQMYAWQGLTVQAETPKYVVDALADNLRKALDRPDVRKTLTDYGLDVTPSTPHELGAYVDQQTKFWSGIVRASGIRLEL